MHRNKILNCIIFLLVPLLSCIFNPDDNKPLLMTRVDSESDTVSLWPRLIFEFSVPLKDSVVSIKITPDPGPVYSSYLNNARDTLTFSVTGILGGNTHYILTPEQAITAKNGNKLYPEDAIFDILTLPSEKEPNNKKSNADTLLTLCYGVVTPANDTDCFYMYNTTVTSLYLKSHDKKSGFFIKDLSDSVIIIDDGFEDIKTFDISDYNTAPIFVYVFSLFDSDTRYELGLIP